MKRKVLSVMLCAAMVVSMTACGGSDAKENTASANASVSETEQGEATEQDAQEEEPITCTLTVWSPSEDQDPEYGQWLNTMCDQFNELHPNWDITFNYGVCTESDAKKLVPQDIDAAADVFIYSSTGLENLCQANSLTEFGGKYLDTIRENYSSVLADSLTYDDGVYGVPMTTNTYFMYYDKSVFSEDDIKSLDTMLEKGKVAIPLNNGFYLASFYLGAGATFFGEEGNVNAYFCGTWQAAQTEEILGDNFGVAPLPSMTVDGEEVQLKPFTSSKAIGVKSTTAYPQVAIELAMYLGGYDSQKLHYETRGYVPCYKGLVNDTEIQKDAVVAVDSWTIENIAVPRANYTEMSYFWTAAESFGNELRDGIMTHENAAEKLKTLEESSNTSGVN